MGSEMCIRDSVGSEMCIRDSLSAVRADFDQVLNERNLKPIWGETLKQFQGALAVQPAIISNGREDGWIMPNHLSTMGFYILRVRSNLVEIRSIIDR